MTLRYVRVQELDSVAVGSLNNGRAQRKAAIKRLRELRRRRSDLHPLERSDLSMAIAGAESDCRRAAMFEEECLRFLEEEANRQGLTIFTPKQRQKREDEAARIRSLRAEMQSQMAAANR